MNKLSTEQIELVTEEMVSIVDFIDQRLGIAASFAILAANLHGVALLTWGLLRIPC